MPITRRLPKRGFTNPFRVEHQVVRLDDLARFERKGDHARAARRGGVDPRRQGSGQGARERRDHAGGDGARAEGQRRRSREDCRGRRYRRKLRRSIEEILLMAQTNAASAVQISRATPELKDKILFTLLCLVLYRIGRSMTAPGIDVVAITDFFANKGGGGCSACTTCSPAASSRARRCSRSGSCRTSRRASSSRSPARWCRRSTRCQKDEEGRKNDQPVVALRHGRPRRRAGLGLRDLRRRRCRVR